MDYVACTCCTARYPSYDGQQRQCGVCKPRVSDGVAWVPRLAKDGGPAALPEEPTDEAWEWVG